jgi:F-type H+-transporting ATPase subunit alpha
MKQPQYQPLQVWEMALTLFAVNNGYFDDIDVKKALGAEKSMRDHLKTKYASLVKTMEDKKDLSPEDEKALKGAIEDWKKNAPELAATAPAKAERAQAKAESAPAKPKAG